MNRPPITVEGAERLRKELERLVRGERGVAVLTGWRREVAGNALLEVLAPAV